MKNISIKSIATFFSCLMILVSTAQYSNKSDSYNKLEKVSNSDKIFDLTVYDSTDLSEEEIGNMDVELVNNYLSNFHKSLTTVSMSEELKDVQKEYEYLNNSELFSKKASEIELFNIAKEWIGENSTIEDVRAEMKKSKEKILGLENGAEFYVTFDYSLQMTLQMMKANSSESMKKSGWSWSWPSADCLHKMLTGAAAGAAIGTIFPVIGNVTGAVAGLVIGSYSRDCD